MEPDIVLDAEVAGLHHGERQRVANGEHAGRRDARRHAQRAGLVHLAHAQDDVAVPAEGRVAVAGDRDQRDLELLDEVDQPDDLVGLAAVAEHHHDVLAAKTPEVPMHRLGGMQEVARRAGRSQRRTDLSADDPGLADPADDARAGAMIDHFRGPNELAVDNRRHRRNRVGLGANHAAGRTPDRIPRSSASLPATASPLHRGR